MKKLKVGQSFEVVKILTSYWGNDHLKIDSSYAGSMDDKNDFTSCHNIIAFAFDDEYKRIGKLTITKVK